MLISEKQHPANHANSQKSTGPASPEGRAAVSRNAIKHDGDHTKHALQRATTRPGDCDLPYSLHIAAFPDARKLLTANAKLSIGGNDD